MTRPKGTPNKVKEQSIDCYKTEATVNDNPLSFIEVPVQESEFYKTVKECLLSIVDALHDKDGDSATWKPIRDNIEAL